MKMVVRRYVATDLQSLVEIFVRAVHEGARAEYTLEQREGWAPRSQDLVAWGRRLESGGAFVCELGQRPIGFVRVGGAGLVDLLFVHPEFQRKGVGRALLEQVISYAGDVELKANVSLTARPLFEKVGFVVVAAQEVARGQVLLGQFRMRRQPNCTRR
jgi:putative acetyltransferase